MLLCWAGVALGTVWFVSFLQTGFPYSARAAVSAAEINTATQIRTDLCGPQTLPFIFTKLP